MHRKMNRSRLIPALLSLLLGAVVFCSTVAGGTSEPRLSMRELPPEIANECAASNCADNAGMTVRWIGRSPRGDLFLIGHERCAPGRCTSWLVEKQATATQTLLELEGLFTLAHGANHYPVVDLRQRWDADGSVYVRFEWSGAQYERTAVRRVYEVNGIACGTRDECRRDAERALKSQQVDRALRILQQVDGVSWI